MAAFDSAISGYSRVPEPNLIFAAAKQDKHPLRGLIDNGPYGLKLGFPKTVRFALLAPHSEIYKLHGLVAELNNAATPKEAKNYYPKYPGFDKLFRTPIAPQDTSLVISFPRELQDLA